MKHQNYLSIVFRTVPKLLREYKNHITQYNPGTIDTNGGTFTVYKSLWLAKCFQLVVAVEMHKPGLFVDSIWMYIYLHKRSIYCDYHTIIIFDSESTCDTVKGFTNPRFLGVSCYIVE